MDPEKEDLIGGDLSETSQHLLHLWHNGLVLIDSRYHDKRLRMAIARAMVDEEYRTGLLERTMRAAPGEQNEHSETTDVRFYVNTTNTLHVLLPPLEREIESSPPALRDALLSRTSSTMAWFQDNWDFSDTGADPPIILDPTNF
ncbi:hypothetical protein, partial [Streptomyces sioyaensis]|uniref:hypothetical protein n=1 Tax=Streptomyces sioyaensis TaxID=67364 RepID=UPI0037239255